MSHSTHVHAELFTRDNYLLISLDFLDFYLFCEDFPKSLLIIYSDMIESTVQKGHELYRTYAININ